MATPICSPRCAAPSRQPAAACRRRPATDRRRPAAHRATSTTVDRRDRCRPSIERSAGATAPPTRPPSPPTSPTSVPGASDREPERRAAADRRRRPIDPMRRPADPPPRRRSTRSLPPTELLPGAPAHAVSRHHAAALGAAGPAQAGGNADAVGLPRRAAAEAQPHVVDRRRRGGRRGRRRRHHVGGHRRRHHAVRRQLRERPRIGWFGTDHHRCRDLGRPDDGGRHRPPAR